MQMNRRNKLILVALLSLGLSLACRLFGSWDLADAPFGGLGGAAFTAQSSVQRVQTAPTKVGLHVVKLLDPNQKFFFNVQVAGSPYPPYVQVQWTAGKYNAVSNVKNDSPGYTKYSGPTPSGGYTVIWKLPVDPNTGHTPQVWLEYSANSPGGTVLTDHFEAKADGYGSDNRTFTRPLPGGGQATQAGLPLAEAQPAQPSAFQDDAYYQWRVWLHLWPAPALTMTASIC